MRIGNEMGRRHFGWTGRIRLGACLLFAALGAVGANAARAGGITVPAAWEGIWVIDSVVRECGDPTIQDQYTDTDTLCTGHVFYSGENCTGTADATHIQFSCESTETFKTCTITITTTFDITRSGDTASGTQTIAVSYSKDCGIPDTCEEITVSGERQPGDPDCNVPIDENSWGRIKALYR